MDPGGNNKKREKRWLRWMKPKQGWWKLNTDGCVKMRGNKAGCGGVIRDYIGDWKCGFTYNMGQSTIEEAEAWGIFRGLKLCWVKRYKKVIMECDYAKLVQ